MAARVRLVLLALVSTLVVAVEAPARADEAAYDHVALPLTGITDIAVDEAHGLAYLSGSATDDRIVVARSDGSIAREITGVTGATDLALNADGSLLYAAVPTADAIAEIDTATSTVRLLPTGGNTCPTAVAPASGEVWYAEDAGCDGQFEVIRVLDPLTGTTRLALGSYPSGWYQRPALRTIPGSDRLLVNDQGVTGGDLDVVDTGTGTVVASTQLTESPADLVVSPDGSEVLVGHWDWPGNRVHGYRLSDLTPTRTLTVDQQWTSSRMAGDADLLAMRSNDGRVGVFDRASGELRNAIRFDAAWAPAIAALALVRGHLLAVSVADGQVRLFHSGEPGVEGTTITAVASDPAYVGHPVTISGTVVDGATPLAGVPVRLLETDGTVFARTTTGTDGTWSVSHTWLTRTVIDLLAVADTTAPHKAAVTTLEVVVEKVPSNLTVSGPDTVPPGAPVSLTGTLDADGGGVPDASVDWDVVCVSPWARLAEGTVATAPDGTFALDWTPTTDCTGLRFGFSWVGDTTTGGSSTAHDVTVTWSRSALALATPATAWVLDDVTAHLALTVDGAPAAGRTVHVSTTAPDWTTTSTDVVTGTDGTVDLTVPAAARGDYRLQAVVDRTADTLGATASATVSVRQVDSALTFAPERAEISAGEAVRIDGTLNRADGRNAGVTLHVIASDDDGARRDSWVTTDADGRFTASDTPTAAGTSTYWVRDEGDGVRYLPSDPSQRTTVSVLPVAPQLRLSTDHASYTAGQVIRVALEAAAAPDAVVTLTAREDGTSREVFRGTVPAGGTTIEVPARFTSTLTATAAATGTTTEATRSLTRPVRLGLATRAAGGTTVGDWQVYPASADPVLVTRVAPDRGGCLRYRLQRRTADGWRQASTSTCRRIQDARVRFVLTGSQTVGTGYRVRPEFSGDARNARTHGAWTRLRFRG